MSDVCDNREINPATGSELRRQRCQLPEPRCPCRVHHSRRTRCASYKRDSSETHTRAGMIHALAGVANAQANCWPLLLLSAGPETTMSGKGAFQETPQLPGIAPYVKYGSRVETMDRIPFRTSILD